MWKGGRVKKVDSIVPSGSTIRFLNPKTPPKVLGKVRDFYIFFDYIYTKVILHR